MRDTNSQTSSNNVNQTIEVSTDVGKVHVILGNYQGLSSPEPKPITITDLDIEQELQAYRERNAKLEVIESGIVQIGDIATIDFEGFIDGVAFEGGTGKKQPLEVGKGSFLKDFEEQLVGMKTNEEKTYDVRFPENYHVKKLAGASVTFKVKVTEIQRKTLPALDDELAKSVSYCKTLDELKEHIKKNLITAKEMEVGKLKRDILVSKVVKDSSMEIPDSLIELEVQRMVADLDHHVQSQGITVEQYLEKVGVSRDEFTAQFRTEAINRVRTQLVLQAIAKAEKLFVTEQEVTNEINIIATTYKEKAENIRTHLVNNGHYTAFKTELLMRKSIEFIVKHSV